MSRRDRDITGGISVHRIVNAAFCPPERTNRDGSIVNPYAVLTVEDADDESVLTLQEPESSLEKLHNAKSLEESITGTPVAVSHDTVGILSSTLPSSCEKPVVGAAESASALASQAPDISSFRELFDTPSRVGGSISTDVRTGCSLPSSFSLGPPIFARKPPDWYQQFFIRMDRGGYFHTYPDVGGPFQSLQDADDTIEKHLHALQLPEMREPDKNNPVEGFVQRHLYYPDGTPRRGPNSPARKNRRDDLHDMVRALLHQFNDHHNLCKDVAHELENLLNFQWIFEEETAYYHFNFTTKTKKADKEYLFFAEVSQPESDWIVTCCCIIKSSDDGLCYGCKKNEGREILHPKDTRAYTGGHKIGGLPLGGDPISDSDEEEDEEAQKEKLRAMFARMLGRTGRKTARQWSKNDKGSAAVEHAMPSRIC